jgi:hypothetical protein
MKTNRCTVIGTSISYITLKKSQRCSVNLYVALQERYFRLRVLKHISSKHISTEYGESGMPCVPITDCLSLTILW